MSLRLRRLKTSDPEFAAQLADVLAYAADVDAEVETSVARILADVQARGDAAVLDYTRRYDQVDATSLASLEIAPAQLRAACDSLPAAQRSALESATARIRSFHERQLAEGGRGWSFRDDDGSLLGQKVTPLDRVGIYVPGGKAAYPSSVLMSAVPAKVAGVGEIVMVAPMPGGARNALVLAAAAIAGVDRVFAIGGAQAIGALAYGTATIPAVHKITGPGNAYVAAAKKRVFGTVGIDMIAGPSEILVLADGTTPPDWVAMDLFSQAEHDELAQSILLCPDAAYIERVAEAIERLLPTMPRQAVIRASLEGRGALILTRSMDEACEISNRIAPEHLEVSATDPHRWEPLLRHAGAIFLGAFTSESLGDYCAGPNHVLPTAGTARFSSPLGVFDFQKRSSLIEVSERGAATLGPIAAELAKGEGLAAHARAAEMRLDGAASTAGRAIASTDERIAAVVRQDVKSMHAYAIQQSAGLVKLDAMENPFRLPEALQDELGRQLGRVAINRYPTTCVADVVSALSSYVKLPAGCKLMLGNGSDELISLLALACDLPGATILAPLPGFVMYEMSAKLQGLRFVGVPLTPRFELDEAAMLAAIQAHRPAITYIAYPNNPTANLFDEAVVERIVAAIGKQNGLVVFDEAYQPFSSRSWMSRVGTLPHVLVMRTLSKFGLAGVRLGYLAGPAALVDEIEKVRPPYNISALNAEATLFALEHANEFARQAALLRGERERLQRALRDLPGVEAFPSEANMILVRVANGAAVFAGMKQRGVLVKNVAGLHPSLANCLRLTVGTPEENTLMIDALHASLP